MPASLQHVVHKRPEIAQIGEKIASVSQVLAKASQGIQSAANVGGNCFEIFDPGAVDRAEEERIQAWVLRIKDGSLLDADAMEALRAQVAENDFQLWLEVVTTSTEGGAVSIDDGQVQA